MQWLWLSIGLLLIQSVKTLSHSKRLGNQNDHYTNGAMSLNNERNKRINSDRKIFSDTDVIDTIQCPLGCVCQFAHFLDLPISRWINYMQMRPEATQQLKSRAEMPIRRDRLNRQRSGGSVYRNNDEHNKNEDDNDNDSDSDSERQRDFNDLSTRRNRAVHTRGIRAIKLKKTKYNNNANNLNEVTYENQDGELLGVDDNLHVERSNNKNERFLNEKIDENAEKNDPSHNQDSLNRNPRIKQATCILQEETIVGKLVEDLPQDLDALILLYTGIGRNKTVNLNVLKPLSQLKTLEIRGLQDRTLKLVFDEPLDFLQHANFESIELLRGNNLNRPNVVHPSDSYNYKPNSEFTLNVFDDTLDVRRITDKNVTTSSGAVSEMHLDFQPAVKELEILPYNVYMQRMKEARMPTFYGWSSLQVLRIHSCQLSEIYWEMFDGLQALQHLSLERNDIEILPPFALFGALHIKTLSLAHNRLRDLHYRGLAGLLELQWLDLSDNRLGWLSEKSFPPFPKLNRIDLSNNPIKFIYPAAFWVMNDTREMVFASQEAALELWNDAPFGSLKKLRELHIGNISLLNLEQNVFKGLIALKILRLRGSVKSIEFDAFTGLNKLQELDLNYCNIQKLSMDAFIGCKNLKVIKLAYNSLSYIPPGLLDDQIQLTDIYLEGNKLYTLPSNFFLLPHLRLAHLNDNPWQCTCDMQNWKHRITNQQRGTTVERCITDFQTGDQISCRHIEELQFNRSLAPRCENFNGQTVYYVLRKHIQCGPGRLVHTQHKKLPHVLGANHQQVQLNTKDTSKLLQNGSESQQQRRQQKQRRIQAQQNDLHYVLHHGNGYKNYNTQKPKYVDKEGADISNNI